MHMGLHRPPADGAGICLQRAGRAEKGTKIFRVVDIPEHKCQGRMRGHYFPSTKRIYKGVMQWEDGSDFGKTVFLTREEAEAALKGGEV